MGFRKWALTLIIFFPFFVFSQNQDSLQQVIYLQALKKFVDTDWAMASLQFTQLINSNFSNKEVCVKRGVAAFQQKELAKVVTVPFSFEGKKGIAAFQQKELAKAKADFDEAAKARINTAELFEFQGYTKYELDDFQRAVADLTNSLKKSRRVPIGSKQ